MTTLLLLKITVLLVAMLAGARLLRQASAAARHRFWTGVFAALLAFPLLAWVGPSLHIPLPERMAVVQPETRRVTTAPARDNVRGAAIASSPARDHESGVTLGLPSRESRPSMASRISITQLLMVTWLVGAAAAAAALMVSLLRVRWLARSAEPALDPTWHDAAHDLAARLGLRRAPQLLTSAAVATPMAAGLLRPTIFLPIAARIWTAEQREVVLAHEIAHLVARDPLRHVVARIAMACYWFHPFAWLVAREADRAREHACDDAVLALGTKPSAYARVLLELAESLSGAPRLRGALPMVEPSMLEKRLMTILNTDPRPRPRRLFVLPALGLALLTLTVAAAQPAVDAPIAAAVESDASGPSTETQPSAQPSILESITGGRPSPTAAAALAQNLQTTMVCESLMSRNRSFNGNISMDDAGGRRTIYEQVGSSGRDRIVQKVFGDLRVCMLAEGVGEWDFNANDRPSQWLDRASRVVLETHRGNRVNQLEIAGSGNDRRTSWRVGGAARPFDQAGQQWRSQLLAVLDTTWELSMLHGQASSLRGDISSIEGERSSLRGEISSLLGEVSSMRGEVSSVLGEESSLRGEISSIRGHVSSLRGAISSERGAISSLNASYWTDRANRDRVDRLIESHEKEIARLEQEIRDYNEEARIADVEKQIAALNAARKVAEIEARIKAFNVDSKIAAIEKEIAKLDVEGQVRNIEGKIRSLDADRRSRQLEDRRDAEVRRLETAISAIK